MGALVGRLRELRISWNSDRMWMMLSSRTEPSPIRFSRVSTRENSASSLSCSPGPYHLGLRTKAWPKGEAGSTRVMTQL